MSSKSCRTKDTYKLYNMYNFLFSMFCTKNINSIDLSATNMTFVTEGEFKSYFLNTHTKELKIYHLVNTIKNQLVIQIEHSRRCILIDTFYFPFFQNW